MKFYFYSLCAAAIVGTLTFGAISCQKTMEMPLNVASLQVGGGNLDSPTNDPVLSSCGDPLKSQTVLGLIKDTSNVQNDKVNMILYHYAQAVRTIVHSPNHYKQLTDLLVTAEESKGISLFKLANDNPSFKDLVNAALKTSIAAQEIFPKGNGDNITAMLANPEWDANSYLSNQLVYEGLAYDPYVYYVRRPIPELVPQQPNVAIGEEVSNCDDVAGWKYNNSTAIVSYQDALDSPGGTLFVGNGDTETAPRTTSLQNASSQRTKTTVAVCGGGQLYWKNYKINAPYRYESNSSSDLCFFRGGFQIPRIQGVAERSQDVGVHRNDIKNNRLFNVNIPLRSRLFEGREPINYGFSSTTFVGAYEWDWWASDKKVSHPTTGESVYLGMKYSNEYYFIKGDFSDDCSTGFGTYEVTNDKGYFKLSR